MKHLNEATENTLKALFVSMDEEELEEALDLLMDESYKRSVELWEKLGSEKPS